MRRKETRKTDKQMRSDQRRANTTKSKRMLNREKICPRKFELSPRLALTKNVIWMTKLSYKFLRIILSN